MNRFNFTPTNTDSQLTVCSGLDNTCHTLNTKFDLGITFHNELLNNNNTFDISAVILKEKQLTEIQLKSISFLKKFQAS